MGRKEPANRAATPTRRGAGSAKPAATTATTPAARRGPAAESAEPRTSPASRAGQTAEPARTAQPPRAAPAGKKQAVTVARKAPALDAALATFTKELRRELREAQEAIVALRAELDALRADHDSHTHRYTRTTTGDGGYLWVDVAKLRRYLAGEIHEAVDIDNYGIYMRSEPVDSNKTYEYKTEPPSTT